MAPNLPFSLRISCLYRSIRRPLAKIMLGLRPQHQTRNQKLVQIHLHMIDASKSENFILAVSLEQLKQFLLSEIKSGENPLTIKLEDVAWEKAQLCLYYWYLDQICYCSFENERFANYSTKGSLLWTLVRQNLCCSKKTLSFGTESSFGLPTLIALVT